MNVLLVVFSLLLFCALTYLMSFSAAKSRLPSVLLALAAGFLFGNIESLQLPNDFFSTLALMAFVVLVFDSSVKVRLKAMDTTAFRALSFIALFGLILVIIFAAVASYVLQLSLVSSVVLALIVLGVSSEFVSSLRISPHINELIGFESLWSSPVVLIAPMLLAVLAPPMPAIFVSDTTNYVFAAVIKIVVSIAAGVFVGILLARLLRHTNVVTAPPAITAAIFIAFGLAYYLDGYGVFAVASLGFFSANLLASPNLHFSQFGQKLAHYAGILTVIMLGSVSMVPLTLKFFATTILLYALYLLARFVAVKISHKKNALSRKEEFMLAFLAPNSAVVCAMILFLTVFPPISLPLNELFSVMATALVFVVYSNVFGFVGQWKR